MKKIFSFFAAALCAASMMAAPTAAPTAPTYPANQVKAVYSATYNADCDFGEWGSGTKYAQEEFGKKFEATTYFGLCFEGPKALNCSKMEKLHLDVYADSAFTIRVVPIHGGAEVGVTSAALVAGQWNSIDIALSEFKGVTNWTNVYQIKIDQFSNQTFWINNVYFYTTQAPEADTEAPTAFTAALDTTNYVSATIKVQATDNSGAVTFIVKSGEDTLAVATAVSATEKSIVVAGLQPDSTYNLSVIAKDEAGNAAEAIAVVAKTAALPALAAAPEYAAEDVLSIYSAHYTSGVNITNIIENWYAAPACADLTVGDEKVLFYYGEMSGCFGIHYDSISAVGFATFELDVYPATTGSMKVALIDVKDSVVAVKGGEWNHIVLPIAGNKVSKNIQVGFYNYQTAGEFLVQNILLVKAADTALENAAAEVKSQKIIRNGQIVIIRNGVEYNAQGQQIR